MATTLAIDSGHFHNGTEINPNTEAHRSNLPLSSMEKMNGHPQGSGADPYRAAEDVDTASLDSGFTETTLVPRRRLGAFDVTSLIVNQMVGIGIFTTPGLVLSVTGSKPVSLVLWGVGGLYTFIS